MTYFTCTEGNVGPALDAVWAGLNVAGAIIIASDPDAYENSSAGIAVGLGWGVLSGSAAVVGMNKTSRCREAKRQLAERQAARSAAKEDRPADGVVQRVILTPATDGPTVGQQVQLYATAYNASGAVIPNRKFSWSSSNDVASISNGGLLTAHAAGVVVVAARTDNVVGKAEILILSPR